MSCNLILFHQSWRKRILIQREMWVVKEERRIEEGERLVEVLESLNIRSKLNLRAKLNPRTEERRAEEWERLGEVLESLNLRSILNLTGKLNPRSNLNLNIVKALFLRVKIASLLTLEQLIVLEMVVWMAQKWCWKISMILIEKLEGIWWINLVAHPSISFLRCNLCWIGGHLSIHAEVFPSNIFYDCMNYFELSELVIESSFWLLTAKSFMLLWPKEKSFQHVLHLKTKHVMFHAK